MIFATDGLGPEQGNPMSNSGEVSCMGLNAALRDQREIITVELRPPSE